MSGADFLALATTIALALLSLALLLTFVRLVRGPTLPDRVLALDMLTTIAIGYVGVFAIKTGFTLYIDIAIAIALAGFLATLAFARYVLSRKSGEESVAADEGNGR
jgi:multicomponent Na+:H+ antiporter subunit F